MAYIYVPGIKHPHEYKRCPTCGEVKLIQKRRTFCSRRCSKLKSLNPAWKGDQAQPNSGRYRAHRLLDRDVCSLCGTTERAIQIHHVDHNPLNNEPENLMVVCSKCHGRQHRIRPRVLCEICGTECSHQRTRFCSQKCMGVGFSRDAKKRRS